MKVIGAGQTPDIPGCVVVPTMGALHAGHAALIRRAVAEAAARPASPGAAVTVFVNPTQFDEPEDYERYPETLDADLAMCRDLGAVAVYVPGREDVYPPGVDVPVGELPHVATGPGLEDMARGATHFDGVCQVLRRLFALLEPSAAVFGEKDWQQVQVARAICELDANGVEVVPEPTVREPDGLAMSSRNVHLTPEDRERGLGLVRALTAAGLEATREGAEVTLGEAMRDHGVEPDYAVVRDARTLMPPTAETQELRMVVAGRVGLVRLLDNAPWPWDGPRLDGR